MKTYTVIKPDDERIGNKLRIATTDIIYLLSEISTDADAIILPSDIYKDLLWHPNFKTYYAIQCYVCPFSNCFFFLGKWWACEDAVSPLLVAMNLLKEKR